MALAIYTGPRTFTELPERAAQQRFGAVTTYTQVYQGLDADYSGWVPALGSLHPVNRQMYLTGASRKDAGGGLIEVTLTYSGTDGKRQVGASGIPYSNLAITVDLVNKSFSWSGPAAVDLIGGGAGLFKAEFSALYSTLEATFSFTAYQYPNGAVFSDLAPSLVRIVDHWTNLNTGPLDAGTYSGYPHFPNPIKPNITVTRFSAKQSSPSTVQNQGEPWDPTPVASAGSWDCTETWGLEYNLGSIGFSNPSYVSPTP